MFRQPNSWGAFVSLLGVAAAVCTGCGETSSSVVTATTRSALTPTTTVYDESLAPGWSDTSFGSTNVFGSTTEHYSGSNSIQWTSNVEWAGFQLYNPAGVALSASDDLQVAVYPLTSGPISFMLRDADSNAGTMVLETPPANQWTVYDLSALSLGFAGKTASYILLQDQSNSSGHSFYLDVMAFTGSCTPTTCAAQNASCGSIADGCGGTLACGNCTAPTTCGGGGKANACGGGGTDAGTDGGGTDGSTSDAGSAPVDIALNKPVTTSDGTPGQMATDGDLNTANYVSMAGGVQWLQVDLGRSYDVSQVKLWHYYGDARTYHDVVVQLSNAASFDSGVTTIFNNDANNTSGLGAGTDAAYAETSAGKSIVLSTPVNARYIRSYSDGSTVNIWNHYVEVEAFGQAAACASTTCAAQGASCGSIGDGCGGTLTCGTCTAPQTCGGGGTANVCGQSASGGPPLKWSATYTVGWDNISPSIIPWSSVTYLMHFALTPNNDGSINSAWFQAVPNQSSAMCAAAHANNRKCMLTVGGYGYGPGYAAATVASIRPTLEANMIAYMQANGYDGIDLDWEDAMVASQYLSLAQELRATFDGMNPKPLLSLAHACWIGTDPNMFQYFDFINVMSYTTPASDLASVLSCYSNVPTSKLGIGLGLGDSGGVDTTVAAVDAKCNYAVTNGYGGVMQWLLDDDYNTNGPSMPLMSAIAPYIAAP